MESGDSPVRRRRGALTSVVVCAALAFAALPVLAQEEDQGGWISGTVTDAATGEPLSGICASPYDESGTQLTNMAGPPTGPDGTYRTDALGAGTFWVEFTDCQKLVGYQTVWWRDAESFETADPITVSIGEEVTGIDAAMSLPTDEGGWISGTVTDAETGDPVRGICPIPYDESGERVEFAVFTGPVPSAFDGSYRIGFLGEGTFRLEFADCQTFAYQSLWWREAISFETADPISVALGEEVFGINISLQLRPGFPRPEPRPDPGAGPTGPGQGAGGPIGPVQSAGGPEPEVQSDRLPFTGPEQPLGLLASLATVILGIGLMLVSSSRRTPHPGD